MNSLDDFVIQIELHSVEGIKESFAKGVDPNSSHNGVSLFYTLIGMYTRSPKFKVCVKAFADHGLQFDDKALLSVLLDDAKSLDEHIKNNPGAVSKKYTLPCTYTPFENVSLLHVCAEFNHVSCAEVLVKHGADINDPAGEDEYGFGGQTPIFHTVNQNQNNSTDMLNYLLLQSATVNMTLKGIIWGKGYEWETLMPAVNPISYAMMGLLPQVHRNEIIISKTVTTLLNYVYGIDYLPRNVPCAYLKKK